MANLTWDVSQPIRTIWDERDATEAALGLLIQAREAWAYNALLVVYGQLRRVPVLAECLDDLYRAWAGRA